MTASPSDLLPRKPWPIWRKILAYLLLMSLASASIWLIDRLAMQQAQKFHDGQPEAPESKTRNQEAPDEHPGLGLGLHAF